MNIRFYRSLLAMTSVVLAGCATCGPGTIGTGGAGWDGFTVSKVCLPAGTVSSCTEHQMVEEDGGGWRIDRDGGGWRIDRDGGGWRRERDEPHHPGDAGAALATIAYVPTGICRIGVPPLPTTMP